MDGWIGLDWILLRRLVLLEHLTVLKMKNSRYREFPVPVCHTLDMRRVKDVKEARRECRGRERRKISSNISNRLCQLCEKSKI